MHPLLFDIPHNIKLVSYASLRFAHHLVKWLGSTTQETNRSPTAEWIQRFSIDDDFF